MALTAALIIIALWMALGALAVALCAMAARGDRAHVSTARPPRRETPRLRFADAA